MFHEANCYWMLHPEQFLSKKKKKKEKKNTNTLRHQALFFHSTWGALPVCVQEKALEDKASCLGPNCGLIAASRCHISFFACQCNDRVWALFPGTSVSWDEVCVNVWLVLSGETWFLPAPAVRRASGKGSNVPLDATRHQGGTSAPGSARVHFWGLLLQFAPLGISELGQRQPDASPTPLSQLDRGGLRAGTQPDPASRRDCRCMILPPLTVTSDTQTHNCHQERMWQ